MIVNSTIQRIDFNDRSDTLDVNIDLKLSFNSPSKLIVEEMPIENRQSIINVIQELILKIGKVAGESQEEFIKVVNQF